jgi:hypothetical protein
MLEISAETPGFGGFRGVANLPGKPSDLEASAALETSPETPPAVLQVAVRAFCVDVESGT